MCVCVFRVIVGAPRDNVTDGSAAERLIRPGAVYQCPFTSSESDCASIVIDREGILPLRCLFQQQQLRFSFDSTVFAEATNVNHADGISRHRLTPYVTYTLFIIIHAEHVVHSAWILF